MENFLRKAWFLQKYYLLLSLSSCIPNSAKLSRIWVSQVISQMMQIYCSTIVWIKVNVIFELQKCDLTLVKQFQKIGHHSLTCGLLCECLITSRSYGYSQLIPGAGRQSSVLHSGTNRKYPQPCTHMCVYSDPCHSYYGMLFLIWSSKMGLAFLLDAQFPSMPFLVFFSPPHSPARIQQSLPGDWPPKIFLFAGVGDPSPFLPLPLGVWVSINSFILLISDKFMFSIMSCSHKSFN